MTQLGKYKILSLIGSDWSTPGVPGSVRPVIEQALAQEPKDRFASLKDFLGALSVVSVDQPIYKRKEETPESDRVRLSKRDAELPKRPSKRWPLLVSAAAGLILLTLLVRSIFPPSPLTPTPPSDLSRLPVVTSTENPTSSPVTVVPDHTATSTPTKAATLAQPSATPTVHPPTPTAENTQPSVLVEYPTENDIREYDQNRIWNDVVWKDGQGTKFHYVYAPGLYEYTLTASQGDRYRFGFIWCEDTTTNLDRSLSSISGPEFYIDGEKIDDRYILIGSITRSNLPCVHHSTMLTDWKIGSRIELEMRYTITDTIEQPGTDFKPGEYRHVVYVSVE